jgi:hypothetical protein
VEVFGGIEPKIELLLPIAASLCEYVSMENIRVSTKITQEFKVDFVMS